MNITGASSNYYNYFNNQAVQGKVSTTSTTEDTSEQKIGKKPPEGMPPQGMPPQGKPPELNLDQDGDEAWSVEELTSFADFSKTEFGTELDVEALMTEYDTDEDGTLTKSEIQSLMDNNGLKLPEKPPKMNDVDEQMNIMAQMQASTAMNAQSLTDNTSSILDYLTDDEDEETSSISSITDDSETLKEKIQEQLLEAYSKMYNQEENGESVSFVA